MGGQVSGRDVLLCEQLAKGGEVHGRQGEGPILQETGEGKTRDGLAILGELGIEGVEDLVVTEGEDFAFEIGAVFGSEVVETTQIEGAFLTNLMTVTDASNNYPIVVTAVGEGGKIHCGL